MKQRTQVEKARSPGHQGNERERQLIFPPFAASHLLCQFDTSQPIQRASPPATQRPARRRVDPRPRLSLWFDQPTEAPTRPNRSCCVAASPVHTRAPASWPICFCLCYGCCCCALIAAPTPGSSEVRQPPAPVRKPAQTTKSRRALKLRLPAVRTSDEFPIQH